MTNENKPKALLFLPYLAPYRIDVLNGIGKLYDLSIAFFYENAPEQNFNQKELSASLKVKHIFLNKGIKFRGRSIKFGIHKLIKETQPDIVFINEYNQVSILLALYRKLRIFNFSLIATTSDNVFIAAECRWFRRISRKLVLTQCDGIVVYGIQVSVWYKNHFPNLKVTICSNIEDPKRLLSHKETVTILSENVIDKYHLHNKKILLFVGRLDEVKNIDLLIEAYDEIYGNSNDHLLFIIGDGPLKDINDEKNGFFGIILLL
jgi:glycosyltransferase involved in cell wall biosynthesis